MANTNPVSIRKEAQPARPPLDDRISWLILTRYGHNDGRQWQHHLFTVLRQARNQNKDERNDQQRQNPPAEPSLFCGHTFIIHNWLENYFSPALGLLGLTSGRSCQLNRSYPLSPPPFRSPVRFRRPRANLPFRSFLPHPKRHPSQQVSYRATYVRSRLLFFQYAQTAAQSVDLSFAKPIQHQP